MTDRTAQPPPFQFTIRQLMAWTAGCALALALLVQFGFLGAVILYCGISAAVLCWAVYRGWWEWAVIASIALLPICFHLLLPSLDHGPGPARRMQCSNHLKQIGLALQNYHDVYGSFPPAYIADANGKPLHSWRVSILPFAEQKSLYDAYRFDEPWDGPNNRKLHNQFPPYFCCPSCDPKQPKGHTNYLAVIGPQTMWPGVKPTKYSDVLDGTSNTIMVVEVASSGIHWMEPRDLHIVQMPMAVNPPLGQGISSPHPNVALAVFADGHTGTLTINTPPDILRALLTIAGNETISDY